jgi:hypothetical protein
MILDHDTTISDPYYLSKVPRNFRKKFIILKYLMIYYGLGLVPGTFLTAYFV